jgi:hypothetical protein
MVIRSPWWLVLASAITACADFTDDDDEGEGQDSGVDTGAVPVENSRLYINEFMASNGSTGLEGVDDDATPDWVELFNAGSFDVDLAGFWLTDDLAEPSKAILGDVILPAGGYVVFIADGEDEGLHLPFKLDADGDALGLFDPAGQPLDRVTFGGQLTDASSGRAPDGGELGLLPEPTPGEANPMEFR